VGRLLTRFTTGEVPGRAGHDLAHYALLCSWPSTALRRLPGRHNPRGRPGRSAQVPRRRRARGRAALRRRGGRWRRSGQREGHVAHAHHDHACARPTERGAGRSAAVHSAVHAGVLTAVEGYLTLYLNATLTPLSCRARRPHRARGQRTLPGCTSGFRPGLRTGTSPARQRRPDTHSTVLPARARSPSSRPRTADAQAVGRRSGAASAPATAAGCRTFLLGASSQGPQWRQRKCKYVAYTLLRASHRHKIHMAGPLGCQRMSSGDAGAPATRRLSASWPDDTAACSSCCMAVTADALVPAARLTSTCTREPACAGGGGGGLMTACAAARRGSASAGACAGAATRCWPQHGAQCRETVGRCWLASAASRCCQAHARLQRFHRQATHQFKRCC